MTNILAKSTQEKIKHLVMKVTRLTYRIPAYKNSPTMRKILKGELRNCIQGLKKKMCLCNMMDKAKINHIIEKAEKVL